jgi:hypothetical protein
MPCFNPAFLSLRQYKIQNFRWIFGVWDWLSALLYIVGLGHGVEENLYRGLRKLESKA